MSKKYPECILCGRAIVSGYVYRFLSLPEDKYICRNCYDCLELVHLPVCARCGNAILKSGYYIQHKWYCPGCYNEMVRRGEIKPGT